MDEGEESEVRARCHDMNSAHKHACCMTDEEYNVYQYRQEI